MYALIYRTGSFLGVFSSKEKMRTIIETIIKDNYEDSGTYGNFNFQPNRKNHNNIFCRLTQQYH